METKLWSTLECSKQLGKLLTRWVNHSPNHQLTQLGTLDDGFAVLVVPSLEDGLEVLVVLGDGLEIMVPPLDVGPFMGYQLALTASNNGLLLALGASIKLSYT